MMYSFCTLFDSSYLSRGLAMHQSLLDVMKNSSFTLYIVAFDDACYETLCKLQLERVVVIALSEFEDEALLEIKETRSKGEYCWTCTPSVILYCIKRFSLDACTYLDADLYFMDSPALLIDEMKEANASILLTEHRYTQGRDKSERSGIYCVQFMTFVADERGLMALNWWREACIEWCYARVEDGKFGDQKYLDDWPERFQGVHVLQHLGGGLAPWNIQQYQFFKDKNKLSLSTNEQKEIVHDAIFYHFHDLRYLSKDKVDLGMYRLSKDVIDYFYMPYLSHLEDLHAQLENQFSIAGNYYLRDNSLMMKIKYYVKRLIRRVLFLDNVYALKAMRVK